MINWGDGTIDTVVGNPPSVTHTYTQAGFTRNITGIRHRRGRHVDFRRSNRRKLGRGVRQRPSFHWNDRCVRLDFRLVGRRADRPYSPIFGPDGDIYVSGYNSDNVVRYDPSGNYLGEFVTSGSGGRTSPPGWPSVRMEPGTSQTMVAITLYASTVRAAPSSTSSAAVLA